MTRSCKNTKRPTKSPPDLRKKAASATNPSAKRRASKLGLRAFLTAGGFKGFTTTFEDLHGLVQLPGLAPQRLMADGYGFAAEGDWKTAALVRAMKVMASRPQGRHVVHGGLHLSSATRSGKLVLGAHMLEICPSIADGKPSLQVHPLGIGGKADPARLVFNTPAGPALNASLMDFGNRFRLLVNEVDVVQPEQPMPKLPVAQAVWKCRPNFEDACACWIYAGGAHHTGFSQAVTTEMLEDFAAIAGIEFVVIDADRAAPVQTGTALQRGLLRAAQRIDVLDLRDRMPCSNSSNRKCAGPTWSW